ncbi:MAG: cyclic nucleotide-binding domain-containing protein [Gammaproteobacteria bacterium]
MSEFLQPYSLRALLDHSEFVEGHYWYRKNYDANQIVFLEGSKGKEMFVILNGKVSVCTRVVIDENKQIMSGLCELFDGDEFAHSCFFDDIPHSATVKTIAPCHMAVIDAIKLKEFLDSNTEIGYRILTHWIHNLLPRIREGNKRLSSLFSWGLKAHDMDSLF